MEVTRMPNLGVPELLIILVIIILIFGVGKLPELGKALGQGIREFREGTQGLVEEDTTPAGPNESNKG
jgi:sec-independent protein translocase protein TatA